jgi:hypothetical protein
MNIRSGIRLLIHQEAVPFDATTGIFLSPMKVVITFADSKVVSSRRVHKGSSNSSGTK